LDVFGENLGFWRTVLALIMHLIPVFVLIAALILAWRWEWIGAVLYAAAGLLHIAWVLFIQHHLRPAAIQLGILMIDVPAFAIAGLFLANWLKRTELRATGR
jgi:glucose-6-phosphate-specific signal transduction histidine kinase